MPTIAASTVSSNAKRALPRGLAVPALSGLGLMAAAALVTMNGEAVVTSGFERAFAALDRAGPAQVAQAGGVGKSYDGVSGSEDFWLRGGHRGGVSLALSVGQEITLQSNGVERRLTVTGVSDAVADATRIDVGPGRNLLLICREGGAASGREVRLMLEGDRIVEITAGGSAVGSARAL